MAALGCASSPSTPAAPVVADIEIVGARQVSPRAIKKNIVTQETAWWPFAKEHRFDPVTWETDLLRIRRYYETRGFYEAEVQGSKVTPRPDNQVALVVRVSEGAPVRIGTVPIEGLADLPPEVRSNATEDLPLEPDEIFQEGEWQAAKRELVRRLRNLGYAEAQLHGEAIVDVGTNRATPRLFVRPGLRYRFGDLVIETRPGAQVPSALIWEQARMDLRTGALFSDEALDEAQRRVFAMGVFSTVRVTPGSPDRDRATIPVRIQVREAPFHSLRVGAGVGIDQIRQEGRLRLEWTDRNFLGGLRRLRAQALAGWAFIPSTYAVVRNQIAAGARHGPIYRATIELEQPRFLWRPSLRLRSVLESQRTLEESYDAIGARTLHGLVWQPYTSVTAFPAYHLQGYWLDGPRAAGVRSAPLALGCRTDPCFILLSYLEQTLAWDRRDSPLEPSRGFYLRFEAQQGGGPLGGDFEYLRFSPEARGYLTVSDDDRLTVAARLRLGTLLTSSGSPDDSAVVTRFYSGGGTRMRGFASQRLSPLLLAPAPGARDRLTFLTLPIGGNGLLEGSLEARFRLTDTLTLAVFVDQGVVTRRRLTPALLPRLQWAAGFGLRYVTAIGPIRIDLARRLPFGRPPPLFDENGREITYLRVAGGQPGSERGANVNDSCFGLGGSARNSWVRDGLCAFHISIGEAF